MAGERKGIRKTKVVESEEVGGEPPAKKVKAAEAPETGGELALVKITIEHCTS